MIYKKILIISILFTLMIGLVACSTDTGSDKSVQQKPVQTHHSDPHHSDSHH